MTRLRVVRRDVSNLTVAQMRKTYAWRKLSQQVVREEPTCRLRLSRCTGVSTSADHIVSAQAHPELFFERSNCQGACSNCNNDKGSRRMSDLHAPKALSFFNIGCES